MVPENLEAVGILYLYCSWYALEYNMLSVMAEVCPGMCQFSHAFWDFGAMGGVALFGLDPGFLMLGQIGIMGKVGMRGMGSSTMELIGGTLLRVLRVPLVQSGQELLLFQVVGFFCLLGAS